MGGKWVILNLKKCGLGLGLGLLLGLGLGIGLDPSLFDFLGRSTPLLRLYLFGTFLFTSFGFGYRLLSSSLAAHLLGLLALAHGPFLILIMLHLSCVPFFFNFVHIIILLSISLR